MAARCPLQKDGSAFRIEASRSLSASAFVDKATGASREASQTVSNALDRDYRVELYNIKLLE